MTEDEDEIKSKPQNQQEIWSIKRDIKVSFKRDACAPETVLSYDLDPESWYYKIGRKMGRGSFGKVNIALHKLTRKVVAVKSINKMKQNKDGEIIEIFKHQICMDLTKEIKFNILLESTLWESS